MSSNRGDLPGGQALRGAGECLAFIQLNTSEKQSRAQAVRERLPGLTPVGEQVTGSRLSGWVPGRRSGRLRGAGGTAEHGRGSRRQRPHGGPWEFWVLPGSPVSADFEARDGITKWPSSRAGLRPQGRQTPRAHPRCPPQQGSRGTAAQCCRGLLPPILLLSSPHGSACHWCPGLLLPRTLTFLLGV